MQEEDFMSTLRTDVESVILISEAGLTLNFAAFGQDAKTSRTAIANQSDTQGSDSNRFVKEADQGGLQEVELGNLAPDESSNADVKNLAQRMVADHSKANDQLRQLAAQKGID
jgi:putative membrane protein